VLSLKNAKSLIKIRFELHIGLSLLTNMKFTISIKFDVVYIIITIIIIIIFVVIDKTALFEP
jgi:hypothetical protein